MTKRMIDENQSQDCCFYGGVGTTTEKRTEDRGDTSDFLESREEETGNRKYGTIRCIRSLIVGEVLN